MNRPCWLLLLCLVPQSAAAQGGMYAQGRVQFSLVAGNAYAFEHNYLVVGAGASYYVVDGLALGFSIENWSGGDPGITKLSPFAQYVFYQANAVQPYAGGFYRHTVISGLPGFDSAGARVGLYIASGRNSSFSFGLVHESYLDCGKTIYRTCSETYPDISLTFGF